MDASLNRANERSQIYLQEVCLTSAAMNRRDTAVTDMPCCGAHRWQYSACGVVVFVQDRPRINGSAWH